MYLRLLIPMFLFNLLNLTFFKGLVSISYSCHFVLQRSRSIFFLFTISLRKWHVPSMCLLRPWHIRWFFKSIAHLLSTNKFIFLGFMILSSSSIISIITAWHAAYDATTYSTSQYDKARMFCFLELQEIRAPSIMNMYPVILFFSSWSPLKSDAAASARLCKVVKDIEPYRPMA